MSYQNSGITTIEVNGMENYTTANGIEVSSGSILKMPTSEWENVSQEDRDQYGLRTVGAFGLRGDISEAGGSLSAPSSEQVHRSVNDTSTPNTLEKTEE